MRPTCNVHVVWHHFVLELSTSFFLVLWLMLWPHHQMWLMWLITSNPNPRVLKIAKVKNKNKNKYKNEKENKKKQNPLSTILIEVGVSSSYSSNKPSDIEAPVNKVLHFCTALSILYVNPDNYHVWLGGDFNNSWLRSKSNIVEDLILLNDEFDIIGSELIL